MIAPRREIKPKPAKIHTVKITLELDAYGNDPDRLGYEAALRVSRALYHLWAPGSWRVKLKGRRVTYSPRGAEGGTITIEEAE